MMKAGRELDALVAEKVMGVQCMCGVRGHSGCCLHEVRDSALLANYSTDIAAAWQVVDRLIGLHFRDIEVRHWIEPFDRLMPVGWMCKLESEHVVIAERADTAPLAICLSALKAMGMPVSASGS